MKNLLFYLLFVIVCAVVIVNGILGIKQGKEYLAKAEKTEGRIVYVTDGYINVKIEVKGKEYHKQIHGEYQDKMRVGDKIEVYYDKEDPNDIRMEVNPYAGILYILFGGIFEIALIWRIIKDIKWKKEGNKR